MPWCGRDGVDFMKWDTWRRCHSVDSWHGCHGVNVILCMSWSRWHDGNVIMWMLWYECHGMDIMVCGCHSVVFMVRMSWSECHNVNVNITFWRSSPGSHVDDVKWRCYSVIDMDVIDRVHMSLCGCHGVDVTVCMSGGEWHDVSWRGYGVREA
jgi:hypothetical protein